MDEPSVKKPEFTVELNGEDITEKVERIQFRDKIHGSSSDLSIDVNDWNFEWLSNAKPEKGDSVSVVFSYEFIDEVLPAKFFEVDEIEVAVSPDTILINCQQTPLSKSLREKRNEKYEDTTLRAIAEKIASRNDLKIVGKIDNISLKVVNQNDQTDLAFLKKIADDWGQIVKVDRNQQALVSNSWEDLEKAPPGFDVNRSILSTNVRLTDSMAQAYDKARVKYRDADKKETIEQTVDASELPGQGETNSNKPDTLEINSKVENEEQARIKAKEALRRKNKEAITGKIETEGNWVYRAGANFRLLDFGPRFNGIWQLDEPRHTVSKSKGWRVSSNIRKLRDGDV